MNVKVKICGITEAADAFVAASAGADLLGFNFYAGSPRFIAPEKAAPIIAELPASVGKVGVFVNETVAAIAETVRIAGLTAVQLHGDESPAIVAAVRSAGGVPVIKAVAVGPDFEVSRLADFGADAILLDAYSRAERGGTGATFDWEIARRVALAEPRLYLAGGLGPDNVAAAILAAAPYAVDACSRLESVKGRKDARKVREFIAAAKSAGEPF
jgi:phosphoribosylanthranilate isomerase